MVLIKSADLIIPVCIQQTRKMAILDYQANFLVDLIVHYYQGQF